MRTNETPGEIADRIRPALDNFDSWAVHDGKRVCAEFAGFGLVTTYFQKVAAIADRRLRTQQLFVRLNPMEREKEKALAEIARTYQAVTLESAMYFADGRIFFIHTDDSDKIARNRTERYPTRLRGWAVSEANGYTFGEGSWTSMGK